MKLVTLQIQVEVEYTSPHTIQKLIEEVRSEIIKNPSCIRPFSPKNIILVETITSKKSPLANQEEQDEKGNF